MMANIIATVFGMFAILAGAYSGLAAFYPTLPLSWKRSINPVPRLSRAGFALFFLFLGLTMLCRDFFPKPVTYVLAMASVGGCVLMALGSALDARRRSQNLYRLPSERRHTTHEESDGWLAALAGAFFLSAIIWLLLIHK